MALTCSEDYFQNIFRKISRMKALLLDKKTSGIVSIDFYSIKTIQKLY